MNKQEAYKLARYAAEELAGVINKYNDIPLDLETADIFSHNQYFICYLLEQGYEIVKKDESTEDIETTVG